MRAFGKSAYRTCTMIQVDTSPAVPAAAEMAVARINHTTVAASQDTPLSLVKTKAREEMIVRQVLFVNASVTELRPATGGPDHYHWTLKSFLQREYCVRSHTGVLTCTTPEVAPLPDKAEGNAPLGTPGDFTQAVQAEGLLSSTLAARSDEIFDADRRAAVGPFLKAAGTIVAKPVPPRPNGRSAKSESAPRRAG